MSLISLLAGLTSTMTLASNDVTPGKITVEYDRFKDKTSITLMGQRVKKQPIFYVQDSFPGQKPDADQRLLLGFYISKGCPLPNFLADGKRVEPETGVTGINPMVTASFPDEELQTYTFVFNLYKTQAAAQIATAKTAQYKVCDNVYILAPQDQEYLRQVLKYYGTDSSRKSAEKQQDLDRLTQ